MNAWTTIEDGHAPSTVAAAQYGMVTQWLSVSGGMLYRTFPRAGVYPVAVAMVFVPNAYAPGSMT